MSTQHTPVSEFISAVPLLAALDEETRSRLAELTQLVKVEAGDMVFRQGEPGDSMYIIRAGLVEVLVERATGPVVIRLLGRGEFFGELTLLKGGVRSASIRAIRDTELLRIGKDEFAQLVLSSPNAALGLCGNLAHRLKTQTQAHGRASGRKRPAYLGVLTIINTLPQGEFTAVLEKITSQLSQKSRVESLNFSSELAQKPDSFARMVDEAELNNDLLVLTADPSHPTKEWLKFCVRQSDRTVLLVNANADHTALLSNPLFEGADLSIQHDGNSATDITRWIFAHDPPSHFLLNTQSSFSDDIAQMCRRLTNCAPGVVLCGGGARALAHIGVVWALEDAGIKIDRFGGVSMGAFLAALYASKYPSQKVQEICHRELAQNNPFNDFTFPFVSLIRAEKAKRMMKRVFGETHLEQLPNDYFCLSSDLISADEVVHRKGPLYQAIGASMSIPGVAPPRAHGNYLLVDGGVLNNLPTDVMVNQAEGPVIACDLASGSDDDDTTPKLPAAPVPAIARLFVRSKSDLPNILQTMARTSLLGSVRAGIEKRALAQLVIASPVNEVGFFDWKKIDTAVDIGRRAGESALEKAQKDGTLETILKGSPRLVQAERSRLE